MSTFNCVIFVYALGCTTELIISRRHLAEVVTQEVLKYFRHRQGFVGSGSHLSS